jgi:hypothetical protein
MRSRRGSVPRLLLIASGGSSGSHLLARLLARYKPVRTGPDAALFHHGDLFDPDRYSLALYRGLLVDGHVPERFPYGDYEYPLVPKQLILNRDFYGCEEPEDQLRLLQETSNVRELVAALFEHCVTEHGWESDAIMIEHIPSSSLWVDRVIEAFPDQVAVVHLVRDVRDAVASLALQGRYGRLRVLTLEEQTRLSAEKWCLLNTCALLAESAGGVPYVRIRYEDLVRHPEQTVPPVAQELLPEATELRDPDDDLDSDWINRPEEWLNDPVGEISTRSIGRYRDVFPAALVDELLQLEFGSERGLQILSPLQLQQRFGYGAAEDEVDLECTAAMIG